jgi:type II secretory ATPase GspE/PulE/Tfp pilus assembly ATPase PilB-like protein
MVRQPFDYETNSVALKHLFVPAHFSESNWSQLCETKPDKQSLLGWILAKEEGSDSPLLDFLKDLCNVSEIAEWNPKSIPMKGAEEGILRDNGFQILDEKTVCGGPDLPPNLHAYLGEASKRWRWVLVAPGDCGKVEQTLSPTAYEKYNRASASALENVEDILFEALAQNATDIHFEKSKNILNVRIGQGHRLTSIGTWRDSVADKWIRIIKEASGLKFDGHVLPEDGRLELSQGPVNVSMRVGRIPTVDGESIVLRLNEGSQHLPSMSYLGIPDKLQALLTDTLLHDPGLILFTGITGSGKTTSACALLQSLTARNLKLITIEDPIEYTLPGVQQSSVNDASGWSFDNALKAYLRQDPDIILIGEIRDRESARIACRAGLTGHAILGTLHSRDIRSAWNRLQAWGLEPSLLTEAVRVIVHQSLTGTTNGKDLTATFKWSCPQPEWIASAS